MTRLVRVLGMVALAAAQEPAASQRNEIDIVHHLANSHTLEIPSFRPPYYKEIALPQFTPFRVGRLEIDLSPTRHVVFLVLAAVLVGLVFLYTSRAVARAHAQGRPPRGFPAAMEAMALYIRQEVILPNVGPHGEGYVNYLLTVFFFILTCNLLGLLPWSATPANSRSRARSVCSPANSRTASANGLASCPMISIGVMITSIAGLSAAV